MAKSYVNTCGMEPQPLDELSALSIRPYGFTVT